MAEDAAADEPGGGPAGEGAGTRALVAWALYDFGNSAYSAIIQTFVFAAYFATAVVGDQDRGTALWGTTVGVAGLVVAVLGPILGAVADQGGRRKPWIVTFSVACVISTACMWFVRPERSSIPLGIALGVLSTIASEAAVIFYNAMLPGLAPPAKVGRWSGWGWALGYSGGVVSLVVAYFGLVEADPPPFGLDKATMEHVRATFPLVAVWLTMFMLPLVFLTPDTPGTGKPFGSAVRDGFGQIASSLRHVREYRGIVRFLIAKMFYIDALTTVFSMGGVYAATTFGFASDELLMFGIALNVMGALGAAGLAFVDDRIGGRNLVLVSLVGLMITGTGILLVTSKAGFWGFALALGVFVGPVQAASRSYLARVAPAGLRNEFFGLYALSGKATAFLGPMLVGWVTVLTGSSRLGMASTIVFFVVGFVLMLTVPSAGEAKRQAASA